MFAEIFGKLTFGENEYYDNISPNSVSDSYFDIAPGLAVGRKWINRKGFTFELMFGVPVFQFLLQNLNLPFRQSFQI